MSKQVPHLRFPGQTLNKMRRQAKVATGIRDIQMVYGGVFLIRWPLLGVWIQPSVSLQYPQKVDEFDFKDDLFASVTISYQWIS